MTSPLIHRLHSLAVALAAIFLLSTTARANLLLNGDFVSGVNPWTVSLTGGASATLLNQAGTGKIDLLTGGASRSNVQLKQTLASELQASITYTVSFTARAAASKVIDVAICDASGAVLWSKPNVAIQYVNTNCSFSYTAASDVAGAYLSFQVGGNNIDIVFDNVVITTSAKLTWAPPALSNPITVNLGTSNSVPALTAGQDYIIKLPATPRVKRVDITGGRNVVIIGGHVHLAANGQHAFVVNNGDTNRIVHIEGCLVTAAAEGDAVDVSAPTSIVQVQNLRVEHLTGKVNTLHSDIIQPYGGSLELRVDHLTGSSNYGALFLIANYNSNHNFIFKNVNITMEPEVSPGSGGGDIVWLDRGLSGSAGGPVPTFFSNVYGVLRSGETMPQAVFPGPTAADPLERPVFSNNFLTWPNLPWVTGGIRQGVPPGGDFVPSGSVGIGYISPGYLD